MTKPLVVIESPYKPQGESDIARKFSLRRNIFYARAACLDSLNRGETPIAGHLLFTQFLDDEDPNQRHQGIACHLDYIRVCDAVAVYTDLGTSSGMLTGIECAARNHKPVHYRSLENWFGAEDLSAEDLFAMREVQLLRQAGWQ